MVLQGLPGVEWHIVLTAFAQAALLGFHQLHVS